MDASCALSDLEKAARILASANRIAALTGAGVSAESGVPVVWFGESLPQHIWQQAEHAVLECDCVLVVGTSAQVHPAAGLAWIAQHAGAVATFFEPDPVLARKSGEPPTACFCQKTKLAATHDH